MYVIVILLDRKALSMPQCRGPFVTETEAQDKLTEYAGYLKCEAAFVVEVEDV